MARLGIVDGRADVRAVRAERMVMVEEAMVGCIVVNNVLIWCDGDKLVVIRKNGCWTILSWK